MNWLQFIKDFFASVFSRPEDIKQAPMNVIDSDGGMDDPSVDQNADPIPTDSPKTAPAATQAPTYDWSTPEAARHSLRLICDEEGLTVDQKNNFSRTINCESGYNNSIIMYNCEHGFVRSTKYDPKIHGAIISKDLGICQINTYWHVVKAKDFPSEEYILQHVEETVRWSVRLWKVGEPQRRAWICHAKGMYLNYSA